jgi:hypothetical protein
MVPVQSPKQASGVSRSGGLPNSPRFAACTTIEPKGVSALNVADEDLLFATMRKGGFQPGLEAKTAIIPTNSLIPHERSAESEKGNAGRQMENLFREWKSFFRSLNPVWHDPPRTKIVDVVDVDGGL